MDAADLLVENADLIITCAGPAPRRGGAQHIVSPIHGGVIAACQGRITYVGATTELRDRVAISPHTTRIDAAGGTVVPGFVDPHTHVVFGGNRRHELQQRLAGTRYQDIAREGGGIVHTVAMTRATSGDDLLRSARERLDEMLACGTTTCESKSGYGLTPESELDILRVLRRLDEEHTIDVVSTFLGAHEIPPEYRERRSEYVWLVQDMLAAIASQQLAEWCDVFCDESAFTAGEAEDLLVAAKGYGLRGRIHADELARTGGARLAARLGLRSADHLNFVSESDADALADANVCAVLLPIAAFYLKLRRFAPARLLIDRGVAVALGTDVNPGAGYSPSVPFAMTLGCFAMDMTLEEALVAATLNAAWAIDRDASVGSLEPGKLMDAVIIDGPLTELLRAGVPAVRTVIKRGRVVVDRTSV